MLWDDQAACANTLVEKRKTISTMFAILVGLGVFKFGFTQKPDEALVMGPWPLMATRVLLSISLIAFGIGAYLLYTQNRSPVG